MVGSGKITIKTGVLHLDKRNYAEGNPGQLPGDYVRLSITDTGSGIDKDTLPQIV